jgi:hypothetical protein
VAKKKLSTKQRKLAEKQHRRRLVLLVITSNILFIALLVWLFFFVQRTPFDLQLTKVSEAPSVSIFQAGSGKEYLVVDVSITPHTKTPVWITPVTQSYVVDAYGTRHELTPYALENPFDANVYKPGDTARGELSYEIPQHSRHVDFCYVLSGKKLCQKVSL